MNFNSRVVSITLCAAVLSWAQIRPSLAEPPAPPAQSAAAAPDAVRLLREHYAELPQPEGDVTLGDCYQAADDLAHAAEYYQRVYYHYLSGAAASLRRTSR